MVTDEQFKNLADQVTALKNQGSSTQMNLFQRQQGSGADLLFFFSY